jgi:hypothetical protein
MPRVPGKVTEKYLRLGGKVGRIVVCQRVPIYSEWPQVCAVREKSRKSH